MSKDFSFRQIATVHSCYKQKFGVPRQPGLVDQAKAVIEFDEEFNEDYFRELEGFSHIWILFVFHQHLGKKSQPSVRPPRLGGNKKIGVFASRSSFRPNPVGMSVVRLDKIEKENNNIQLHVSGIDLVEGTPVIDIKPYISYSDRVNNSDDGYAVDKPDTRVPVKFSGKASDFLTDESESVKKLISQTIGLDPRPAYVENDEKIYSMLINDMDVKWIVKNNSAIVVEIISLNDL